MEPAKAKDEAARQAELERIAAQAKTELVTGAADYRARFMADRAAKIKADRRAELTHQAAERGPAEAARKVEQERVEQRNPKRMGRAGPGSVFVCE